MRFLMTVNGGGAPPDEQLFAEMGRFVEELTRAGVLLATGGLDRGTHVTSSGGSITLTDGPFTESKEVIVSFALLEVRSKDEALELARRFWKMVGDGEGDIRQVFGPGDNDADRGHRGGAPRDRGGVAAGVRPDHRRPDRAGPGRRPGRGTGAGRAGRRAEQWPADGIPANPGGWLMLTAKHRAVDRIRRNERLGGKLSLLGRELEAAARLPREFDAVLDAEENIGDDLLRLMFISCHPVLSTEARIALTLRLLGGLTTEEIARGFLAAEPTIAKRIVRAKRTLAGKQVPFEVPPPAERQARLASVLEVLYLVFNEGYSAMAGDDWMRPALCTEALRLGRVLAGLMPSEPEVHGLVALMEIQASRLAARLDPAGLPVPLLEQNRGRWDQLLIRRGFTALLRAERLGSPAGPYVLQAAIAACHARRRHPRRPTGRASRRFTRRCQGPANSADRTPRLPVRPHPPRNHPAAQREVPRAFRTVHPLG